MDFKRITSIQEDVFMWCLFAVWLGSIVIRALDLRSAARKIDSWPLPCQVATLVKSFTYMPSASVVTSVRRCRNVIN